VGTAVLLAGALLAACGDEPAVDAPGQSVTSQVAVTATSTTVAGRTYAADLTTTDGHRYRIMVLVGPRSPTGSPDACPGTASPGRFHLPVTLTVANAATDRAAPFPPVRIELTTAPGTKPGQVLVRDPAGTCTFSPRAPAIGPGASAVFQGTSPAIDEGTGEGAAGRIEVKVSETTFSLAAPVP